MPHSQARMPSYLPRRQIKDKPMPLQRRHVNSYFRPTVHEIVREHIK